MTDHLYRKRLDDLAYRLGDHSPNYPVPALYIQPVMTTDGWELHQRVRSDKYGLWERVYGLPFCMIPGRV